MAKTPKGLLTQNSRSEYSLNRLNNVLFHACSVRAYADACADTCVAGVDVDDVIIRAKRYHAEGLCRGKK